MFLSLAFALCCLGIACEHTLSAFSFAGSWGLRLCNCGQGTCLRPFHHLIFGSEEGPLSYNIPPSLRHLFVQLLIHPSSPSTINWEAKLSTAHLYPQVVARKAAPLTCTRVHPTSPFHITSRAVSCPAPFQLAPLSTSPSSTHFGASLNSTKQPTPFEASVWLIQLESFPWHQDASTTCAQRYLHMQACHHTSPEQPPCCSTCPLAQRPPHTTDTCLSPIHDSDTNSLRNQQSPLLPSQAVQYGLAQSLHRPSTEYGEVARSPSQSSRLSTSGDPSTPLSLLYNIIAQL